MKTCLTLLVLAIPFLTFCQSRSIDIGFSPVISDVTLKYGDPEIDEMLRRSEEARFNWIGAIHYNKPLSQSLHLRLGLQLASMGSRSFNIDVRHTSGNFDQLYLFYPENPEQVHTLRFSYSHRYLGAPISLRYEFKQNKIQPYVEAGLIPAFYLNSTITQITNVDRQSINRSEVYHSIFQLAGTFSVGLQYSIQSRIQLFAQPTFRYHFTPVSCDTLVEHMLSAGVEFGIRSSF